MARLNVIRSLLALGASLAVPSLIPVILVALMAATLASLVVGLTPAEAHPEGPIWPKKTIVVANTVPPGALHDAVDRAIRNWSDATVLTLTPVSSTTTTTCVTHGPKRNRGCTTTTTPAGTADVVVDVQQLGDGPAGTTVYSWSGSYFVGPVHVHLDTEMQTAGADLQQRVAAHEIGHALGLAHNDVQGSVMGPGTNPGINSHDIADINGMYP